jgi:branched-chain amino acid transport system substrate-binding protein
MISPTNTAIGLTRGGPGTSPGEPVKYYPTGRRNYFRLAPHDRVQGAALATAMRERGCRRVAALRDGEIYGRGLDAGLRRAARRLGLRIVLAGRLGRRAAARRVRRARADCVAFAGLPTTRTLALLRSLHRVRLFGGDALAGARVPRRLLITLDVRPPSALPPAGQDFFRRTGETDAYGVYGYEAMRLVLDAVASGAAHPAAVIRRLRALPPQAGVLGTYRFDRFGDTTLRTFGLYRVRGAALAYAGSVDATR